MRSEEEISEKYRKQLEKEASRFVQKFLRNERNMRILMKFISPYEFTKLLKMALEDMELCWKDDEE
jgi:hypothetical protein